ncbi:ABC transporter ATP-binding protein/permease [Azospirillum sp. RWY-5-1]|uniref:ABC transporter ATP-binding protein/permease n=1 Tax=Azospirillum oleiclasticum TaxID=2735135 RepID=A0ABX2T3L0_9PROT|nr:ABC transporter ATP-binding protein/permease [Azospirillum oleiclasticum]NYZ11496.1 ABC transporter ATP-binding protein/permease [Azospirillum oleiclasticum]NYZ18657.1 ABC transporter ATP-binding protein/permease [Azospirillum oleiclasticum]
MSRIATTRAFFRDLWTLTRPYWSSEERWAARGLLAVIILLNLGQVYLNVLFNAWNNDFYNALQEKNEAEYSSQLLYFTVLATIFIAVAVYNLYLNQMLQIRWRRWLTDRYLKDWLAGQTYYRLQFAGQTTDNPDQRIADDLRLFVAYTLTLTLGFLSNTVNLVSFLGILWALSGPLAVPLFGHEVEIPGYMVWVAVIYALAGSVLTHLIGRPLARLNFDQQRYEADFRFSLIRLRENAEGVALHGGEAQEQRGFAERFGHVVANWWSIMRTQKRLTWFTSGYGQVAIIFPFVVGAPRYFAGQIQLGGLMQISSTFGQVQESLSWFISAYVSLTEWKATVDRLIGFHRAVAAVQAASRFDAGVARVRGERPELELKGLTLTLPLDRRPLVHADLTVAPGERVLVTGASGSGKSTLFRAIAGIWPFGAGTVRLPASGAAMFLPQKPYMPIGSLAAAVTYPDSADAVPAETVRAALDAVGMGAMADRLDEQDHWGQRLSGGEQQRIAFARVLLHRPAWLFMDEATSACDPETEARLYGLLRERLPGTTVVSIGHRTSLTAFHDRLLTVRRDAGGVGELVPAATAA